MSLLDPTILVLLALAVVSMFAGNHTVAAAMAVLIVIRVTPLALYFPWLQKHGLNIGIFLLMVAVMVPIASGKIPAMDLLKSFTHWKSAVAIVVGIFVAWLGGRGVTLMAAQPGVVAGLMVGTILGVAFFRGVPVGPLIAAGVVSLLIGRS
ncbi:DUF441 domain-containing protein [Comamonas endophytica]|uniref:UPF0756 membrane protein M9799_17080 n=1 Tax=Comamonas endophytica TaxID=2949090 RepID=A0ABY6GG46_9BURK|nr:MULTISPECIES: DUF441 domain-containing protein [unclassified Acidovorax]MCD2514364.1 DUF441 domain-containing protein [Acidovorax sp. D4N7]UYG53655.1 DUF441 domain-containing protein [Acidovorax sp. 5MLIR]